MIPVNSVAAGAEVFKVLMGSLISGARLKEFVLAIKRRFSDKIEILKELEQPTSRQTRR